MCVSYGSKSSKSPIVPVLLLVSTYEAISVACVCMPAPVCTHRCLHICLLTYVHLCAHMVDALSCSARWSPCHSHTMKHTDLPSVRGVFAPLSSTLNVTST